MKRIALLLGCLCISAAAQQNGATNPVLLDAAHPSVYLQYDHEAERKPEHPGEGKEGLWLSIHNNTRAAICIRTQSLYIGPKVAPLKLGSGKDRTLDGKVSQVKDIKEAQKNARAGKTNKLIDSTKKSEQNLDNHLKNIHHLSDVEH